MIAQVNINELAVRARVDPASQAELLVQLTPLITGAAARIYRKSHSLYSTLDYNDFLQQAHLYLLGLIDNYDPALGWALPYFSFRLNAKLLHFMQREFRLGPKSWAAAHNDAVTSASDHPELGFEYNIQQALDQLSSVHRLVLQLAYIYDLSDQQIAERLARNLAAVRQLRYRALRRMKELL